MKKNTKFSGQCKHGIPRSKRCEKCDKAHSFTGEELKRAWISGASSGVKMGFGMAIKAIENQMKGLGIKRRK